MVPRRRSRSDESTIVEESVGSRGNGLWLRGVLLKGKGGSLQGGLVCRVLMTCIRRIRGTGAVHEACSRRLPPGVGEFVDVMRGGSFKRVDHDSNEFATALAIHRVVLTTINVHSCSFHEGPQKLNMVEFLLVTCS